MRHLVPCLVDIATSFHRHMNTVKTKTILDLFSRLLDFYMVISSVPFEPKLLHNIVQDFCLLYKALVVYDINARWFMKPKLHMMQELAICAFDAGEPINYWTYQDEDFMGVIARMSSSRGGPRNAASISNNVFSRIGDK